MFSVLSTSTAFKTFINNLIGTSWAGRRHYTIKDDVLYYATPVYSNHTIYLVKHDIINDVSTTLYTFDYNSYGISNLNGACGVALDFTTANKENYFVFIHDWTKYPYTTKVVKVQHNTSTDSWTASSTAQTINDTSEFKQCFTYYKNNNTYQFFERGWYKAPKESDTVFNDFHDYVALGFDTAVRFRGMCATPDNFYIFEDATGKIYKFNFNTESFEQINTYTNILAHHGSNYYEGCLRDILMYDEVNNTVDILYDAPYYNSNSERLEHAFDMVAFVPDKFMDTVYKFENAVSPNHDIIRVDLSAPLESELVTKESKDTSNVMLIPTSIGPWDLERFDMCTKLWLSDDVAIATNAGYYALTPPDDVCYAVYKGEWYEVKEYNGDEWVPVQMEW